MVPSQSVKTPQDDELANSSLKVMDDSLETGLAESLPAQPHHVRAPIRHSWLYRTISFFILASIATGLVVTRSKWQPVLDAFIRPNASADKPKPRPPLVTLAEATIESIPQYINCLGTVTAFNSVIVKSRVDGELIDVAFREGQIVEQGQMLAKIDPRSFASVRDQFAGQLQRDEAALQLASLNYERAKKLPLGEAMTQQELDEQFAMFKQSQANVEVTKALLSNAALQLTYTDITAPIRGRVGLRIVDRGNMIKASDPTGLVVITQLQPISVVFPIPQDEIPRIQKRLGEAGATEVRAYDRSFQTLLATGKLAALDNQVDSNTGTLRLKATFDNETEALFPNQFVNIRLLVRAWENAIVVPTSSIQRGADFSYVYVAKEDSTVDVQRVVIAFAEAGKSVIESGLTAGQKVVTEGTDKLQPKGKVTLPGAKGPDAPARK